MSIIAVVPSVLVLLFGTFVLAMWSGYAFDLRRNKTAMLGGRRAGDR